MTLSLLFGFFWVPFQVKAQDTALESGANFSYTSVVKNTNDNKNNQIDENVNVDVSHNALVPKTSSWGAFDEQNATDSSCSEPNIYVVKDEDSISKVALMLDVTENTVLAANNMKKNLVKDSVLFIPSVPGVIHTVAKGQTMQSISKLYKIDINDIAFCNGITPDTKLKVDTELTIPGGQRAEEVTKPVKKTTITQHNYQNYSTESLVRLINPVPGYRLSQGLHDGNAVDLAIVKGTPIHAAASGKVIFAKMGYNGGFGGLVIIVHSGGVKTMYGHMSKIIVNAGDPVAQHDIIGNVGSTGRSTGPHVHFVVEGEPNPGVAGFWAN